MDKTKYLNDLKKIVIEKTHKSKVIKHKVEEGTIRGLATIPYRFIQDLAGVRHLLRLLKDPIERVEYIKKELTKFKIKLKLMDLDLGGTHNFLKFLDKAFNWTFYIILNDKVYNFYIEEILKNPADRKIVNKWIDTKFSQRTIPEIYNAKHTDDLVKIIDKYIERVDEIGKLVIKYPEKRKNLNILLQWGIAGIIDLVNALHSMASYGAK